VTVIFWGNSLAERSPAKTRVCLVEAMPPKRSTRKSATKDPIATEDDRKESNIEENDDMDEDSNAELGFESALEDPFSGESDYYQPSDDDEGVEEDEEEEEEEEIGMQKNFQGMELDNRDYNGFEDDEEINERQFEYVCSITSGDGSYCLSDS
jgi:hypothetical protein